MTLEMRDEDNRWLGREEGRLEGREEGREEGRDRFAALLKRLKREGKTKELERCLEDPAFSEQLYPFYQL